MVLDVDEDGDRQERAEADEEEEPVEELHHDLPLRGVRLVELVGTEARDTGLEPTSNESGEVESDIEDCELGAVGGDA